MIVAARIRALLNGRRFLSAAFLSIFLLGIVSVVQASSHNLVNVLDLDPTIRKEIRYATAENFMKEVLYADDRCFLLSEVAERIVKAHRELQKQGLGIKV